MALPPTSNVGSDYFNINQCRTFSMRLGTSLTMLSSVGTHYGDEGQACSEVIILNKTGGLLTIYDKNNGPFASGSPKGAGGSHGFLLADGAEFTFRGLTNVKEVSALAAQTGPIYYRTQFFSYNPR